ncbi:hypothetical protein EMN47_15490 [Prolixibacteraceae bacterium JC049]|nr:hypothetical protein [Prolixibacteraceae bacterium JC049]
MMEFIMDDSKIENQFKTILKQLNQTKNGVVADSLTARGFKYKMNLGSNIVTLRGLAKQYDRNHLLALKLWNKQWRETMILATMLEEPSTLTEQQMDYWAKSFETTEIAEQAVINLFPESKFAYIKALEWCRGKKFLVKYTGLLLMGRLAMVDKKGLDEMFEPFLEVIAPLMRDPQLSNVMVRSFGQVGRRSKQLNDMALEFLSVLRVDENKEAQAVAEELITELSSEWVQESFKE